MHIVFIDVGVLVIGDRLVTQQKIFDNIEVRLVHIGQVVNTICTNCLIMTSVPGHSELLVIADSNGAVNLWDNGTLACEMHQCESRCARAPNCAS
jgi:hypothetical protein